MTYIFQLKLDYQIFSLSIHVDLHKTQLNLDDQIFSVSIRGSIQVDLRKIQFN